MAVRLVKRVRDGDVPVAECWGGEWDEQTVVLARKEARDAFPGLIAPEKTSFFPSPESRDCMRDVIYAVGPSGCGKSTFAGNYARVFIETFKRKSKEPVIMIACKDDPKADRAFKDLNFLHIDPAQLVDEPVELDDLVDPDDMPRLIIFDDCEAIIDAKQSKAMEAFQGMVLERGRKKKLYILYISHRPAAGRITRAILQELTAVWISTRCSYSGNLSYMMKTHLSLDPELRREFRKNSGAWGSWVYIKQDSTPRLIISPKRCLIYDDDVVEEALRARKLISRKITDAAARVSAAERAKSARSIKTRLARADNLATRDSDSGSSSSSDDDDDECSYDTDT